MQLTSKILCLIFLFGWTNAFATRRKPYLVTKLGSIQGRRLVDSGDRQVDGFYAIPYAKAPIGALRFEKPVAYGPWPEPLLATHFGPKCVQRVLVKGRTTLQSRMFRKNSVESEDCLLLNVFAPAWGSETTFPVMFWIHGGGYNYGSSVEYGDIGIARNLVAKGVIVVTINYRLGPWGFFTTGDEQCPGNFGLWDQALALQWVNDNIAAFNGNPNKITVFGQSAGGASTEFLALSPHTRNLFDQAIPMAGSSSAPWAMVDTKLHSSALAAQLNCTTNSSQIVMECIQAKSNAEIHEAISVLGPGATDLTLLKFSPIIDGDFLPHDIQQLRKEAPKKRVITGVTEREGGFMTVKFGPDDSKYHSGPNFNVADLKKFLAELLPESSYHNYELLQRLAAHEYLRKGDAKNHTFLVEQHMKAVGDQVVNVPLYKDVQTMVDNGWTVYLYSFDYANPEAFTEGDPVKKPYHLMELPYLFGISLLTEYKFNKHDKQVLRSFTRWLTNFAKYGDPNGVTNTIWKPLKANKRDRYLSISDHPTFKQGFYRSATDFWLSLVPHIEGLVQYRVRP